MEVVVVPSATKKLIKDWNEKQKELEEKLKLKKEMVAQLDTEIKKLRGEIGCLKGKVQEYMNEAELEELKFKGGGSVKMVQRVESKVTEESVKACLNETGLDDKVKGALVDRIKKLSEIEHRYVKFSKGRKGGRTKKKS